MSAARDVAVFVAALAVGVAGGVALHAILTADAMQDESPTPDGPTGILTMPASLTTEQAADIRARLIARGAIVRRDTPGWERRDFHGG